jgi:hypothetical protein
LLTVTASSSASRAIAVALGAALLAIPAARAGAQPGTRCDGSQAAKLLGLATRDWQVACWALADGRRVIAGVPLAPLTPAAPATPPGKGGRARKREAQTAPAGPLVVRLGLAKDEALLWRGELRPEAKDSLELRDVLEKSEEWLVGIEDQPLGADRGVRIGVVGHWGTDTMIVREIALLYRLPAGAGPMRLVWSGVGNTRESRLDYCRIEGIATFQLVDAGTLERRVHVSHNINHEVQLPRARARALEKQCVPREQPPQRFPLAANE